MNPIFIPKEDPELPDSYSIVLTFHDGKKEEFEVVSHAINYQNKCLDIVTKDDLFLLFPNIEMIRKIEFGKGFSKIVALKNKVAVAEGK